MEHERVLKFARQFNEARINGHRLSLLSLSVPDLDLAAAEQIAQRTTELSGSPVVGYKLGYTSQVMRTQMGIASPNWGRLTKAMDLGQSPQPLLVHPRIEPEIAIVMNRTVVGADCSLERLRAAIRSVHIALEIVDTRYVDYRFTLEDNSADASSAAAFILGPAHPFEALADAQTDVKLFEGDNQIGQGHIKDAMGGPLLALKWLAQELQQRSLPLEAGMVVMTGGLTAAALVRIGVQYRAEHGALGTVCFQAE